MKIFFLNQYVSLLLTYWFYRLALVSLALNTVNTEDLDNALLKLGQLKI
jgi:hypothetical protein